MDDVFFDSIVILKFQRSAVSNLYYEARNNPPIPKCIINELTISSVLLFTSVYMASYAK